MKAARARDGGRIEFPFRTTVPYAIPFVLAGAALLLTAPNVWLVLLTDGVWPVAVVASAAGWGAWPARLLRGADWTAGQEFSVAVALGLGVVGVLTLALGVVGALGLSSAAGLLAVGGLAGLVRLVGLARGGVPGRHGRPASNLAESDRASRPSGSACPDSAPRPARRQVLLATLALLPLCVPLYVMAFGACLPPGVLWPEESNGYDVFEYHLQGPREWYERGRIEFLPHNVYTSFPQQTEILYLLLMHLHRDAHAAAIPSQLLHAAMGVLAVFAIGAWLPAGWPRIFGVALAGTTPWIAYLGCLAYVENTMLLFAAVAAGIVLTWYRDGESATRKSALAAGLCAGLAGACKYTGLVFVAAALFAAIVLTLRPALRSASIRRFLAPIAACFLLGVTLGIGPWLGRNAAFTGNPVYPFAFEWFGGRGWSADQADQWRRGHAPPADQRGVLARLARGLDELYQGTGGRDYRAPLFSNFGWLTLAMLPAAAAVLYRRDSVGRVLIIWILLVVVAWLSLTYIPARFVMVLIVPAAILIAHANTALNPLTPNSETARPRHFVIWVLIPAIGSLLPLVFGFRTAMSAWEKRIGIPITDMVGRTDAFVANHPLNVLLPKASHAWLIGDAAVFYLARRVTYHTVFDGDPWIEFSRDHDAAAAVAWLRERGVTHVVFNWPEIERLRKTYGFSDRVTREWAAETARAGLEPMPISSDHADALRGVQVLIVKP